MGLDGMHLGYGVNPAKFARRVVKAMQVDQTYRVLVAHVDNEEGARQLRREILEGHPKIHSCHLAEAGPALGVHMGIGGLIVGFTPDPYAMEAH
jgi:fatty acid-binding protein DegV